MVVDDELIRQYINLFEAKEMLKEFEKDMTKKGINKKHIKDMTKNGVFMTLPSKMVHVFEEEYGYNPNILWC